MLAAMTNPLMTAVVFALFAVFAAIGEIIAAPALRQSPGPHSLPPDELPGARAVGIGTVRSVTDPVIVEVEVEGASGPTFIGSLRHRDVDADVTRLRPGVVLLVTFDPAAREHLWMADDMVAVRVAFDQMLVRKGLVSHAQLDLIRHGTRSRGIITAMRATGFSREDYLEVELDLMVSRPDGGQFPAQETALIPRSALDGLVPGSVIDTYYRRGDEDVVTVCVQPG